MHLFRRPECFARVSGSPLKARLHDGGFCGIVVAMTTASVSPDCAVQFAMQSDPGTERGQNEDACGSHVESATHVLVAVADGVSGEDGGDVASSMAIDVTLRAYR